MCYIVIDVDSLLHFDTHTVVVKSIGPKCIGLISSIARIDLVGLYRIII